MASYMTPPSLLCHVAKVVSYMCHIYIYMTPPDLLRTVRPPAMHSQLLVQSQLFNFIRKISQLTVNGQLTMYGYHGMGPYNYALEFCSCILVPRCLNMVVIYCRR